MSRAPAISDAEEQELIESSERGEWVSVSDIETQRAFWQEVAKNTLDGKRQKIADGEE